MFKMAKTFGFHVQRIASYGVADKPCPIFTLLRVRVGCDLHMPVHTLGKVKESPY